MKVQLKPAERLFRELEELSERVEDIFRKLPFFTGDAPIELRSTEPFSAILRSYEGILADGHELPLSRLEDELAALPSNVYYPYQVSFNTYELGQVLKEFYEFPAEVRDRAERRSNELLAIRLGASLASHRAVWDSELPVGFLNAGLKPQNYYYGSMGFSYFEHKAYTAGHDAALSEVYGYEALLLLSPEELAIAAKLLHQIDPQLDLGRIGELAALRPSAMTPEILLEALELGYESAFHLRTAGNILGRTPRNKDFFKRIFAEGSDLVGPAWKLAYP